MRAKGTYLSSFIFVFWYILPCKIIVDRRFRGTCCLNHLGVERTYLWNVGRQLFYTAVHPRRQIWISYSPPWELEISHIFHPLDMRSSYPGGEDNRETPMTALKLGEPGFFNSWSFKSHLSMRILCIVRHCRFLLLFYLVSVLSVVIAY
jgi:hypothetical protein